MVEGAVPEAEKLAGTWVRAFLGEELIYGYEVSAVCRDGDHTVIEIATDPAFAVDDEGRWELLFDPFSEGVGPCQVEITRSVFAARP